MRNGKTNGPSKETTGCSRDGCTGCIPTQVLVHKLSLKQKPTCRVCESLRPRQTRYFKLVPGSERPFVPNPNKANEALKKEQAEVAKLKSQLALLKAQKTKDPNPTEEKTSSGFPKEEAAKLKIIGQKRAAMLALSEEDKIIHYDDEETFQAKLQTLQAEKDKILANTRALRPLKDQLDTTTKYVQKLEGEMQEICKKRDNLLDEWAKLEDELSQKNNLIKEKREELAVLSEKVAKENASALLEGAKPTQEKPTKLEPKHKISFENLP